MKTTQQLHALGQSLWVDNITRAMLDSGAKGTIAAAARLHQRADRANLYIKIPGTPEGVVAIEESLFAGASTKDPAAPYTLYVEALAAPDTINTLPEKTKTLFAFADHGQVQQGLQDDGGDADGAVAACREAGVDIDALAEQLQREGAEAFSKSWSALLKNIDAQANPSPGKTDE